MGSLSDFGDVASIVGLVLTIGGFGVTLWQIQKSKSASEQARDAAEATRAQILQMNAIQEISAASKAFEDIRRLHRLKAWEALPDRYTSLKQLLISIKGRTPRLNDQQKSEIQGAIQQLSNFETQIEAVLEGTEEPLVSPMNDIIAKQIERMAYLLVDLQNEIERLRKMQ